LQEGWKAFCKKVISGEMNIEAARREASKYFHAYGVYPESINLLKGCIFFMTKDAGEKKMVIIVDDLTDEVKKLTEDFQGETESIEEKMVKLLPLSHHNARALRKWFTFTSPVAFGKGCMSMGLGDRLGLASPGHLRLIKKTKIRPVLAQQSIRELNLTERTYEDVLDAASWAVFQEGYRLGFGADGDHLKTEDEVKMALDLGFSMITLDCSEMINNDVPAMSDEDVEKGYYNLEPDYIKRIEQDYLDSEFSVKDVISGDIKIAFDGGSLKRIVLIYGKALDFINHIYHDIIKPAGRKVDFEVSIDETMTPTTPQAHFFVASELKKKGVDVTSLAPRFCGEFQKAIDYIGDIEQFEREFKVHAAIADHFGYRLSIHSGSDKFKVFPIIGKYTKGRVHVKTAGTNWLEALKVIAHKKPDLFRKIYIFALEHFHEATRYYHVTTNLANVPDISIMSDEDLPHVLIQDDARQVLHITYGLILTAKNEDGKYLLKDDIYSTLNEHEEEYYKALEEHIGKHLKLLQASV
jgi:hypothetical protein